jgi:hypothetical protein
MPIALPEKPPLIGVPVSRVLWRLHRTDLGAIWFGPRAEAIGRFDDPALGYGVLYFR